MPRVLSIEVFKTGTSDKTGKPWKLFRAQVEGRQESFSGFDDVQVGEEVSVYQNDKGYWTYKKMTQNQKAIEEISEKLLNLTKLVSLIALRQGVSKEEIKQLLGGIDEEDSSEKDYPDSPY